TQCWARMRSSRPISAVRASPRPRGSRQDAGTNSTRGRKNTIRLTIRVKAGPFSRSALAIQQAYTTPQEPARTATLLAVNAQTTARRIRKQTDRENDVAKSGLVS